MCENDNLCLSIVALQKIYLNKNCELVTGINKFCVAKNENYGSKTIHKSSNSSHPVSL